MELRVGDRVRVERMMHTMRNNVPASYSMVKEGVVVELKGLQSAVVRVEMKKLRNGDWSTCDMLFNRNVLSKPQAVSA
jgi:hypothetical protein